MSFAEKSDWTLQKSIWFAGDICALFAGRGDPFAIPLVDFMTLNPDIDAVLFGALATNYHARKSGPLKIEFLLASAAEIERVNLGDLFERRQTLAIEHRQVGTEIKLVTHESAGIDSGLVSEIIKDSENNNINGVRIRVAGRDGLIAYKLHQWSLQDQADIEAIFRKGGAADLAKFNLSALHLQRYHENLDDLKKITKEITCEYNWPGNYGRLT